MCFSTRFSTFKLLASFPHFNPFSHFPVMGFAWIVRWKMACVGQVVQVMQYVFFHLCWILQDVLGRHQVCWHVAQSLSRSVGPKGDRTLGTKLAQNLSRSVGPKGDRTLGTTFPQSLARSLAPKGERTLETKLNVGLPLPPSLLFFLPN